MSHSSGFSSQGLAAMSATMRGYVDPKTVEATIVRDADILEQLGAVGILRAVSKIGRDTRYATCSEVVPQLRKALVTLPPLLRLNSAKALALPRIQALESVLAAVDAEAKGELH